MQLNDLQAALGKVEGPIAVARKFIYGADQICIIGNGGSAAIASHIAVDFTKNARLRAQAFNDISLLTCFANDYGHEEMFVQAIKQFGADADCLIAISSSGKSLNILNAVHYARDNGYTVVTLSGFEPDNPLRALGDANLYVPAKDYGTVEIAHLAILHSMVPV